jgi:hypothetical protein
VIGLIRPSASRAVTPSGEIRRNLSDTAGRAATPVSMPVMTITRPLDRAFFAAIC